VNAACFSQRVTIHIVDVTNESPVRNQHIYISGISRKAASEGDERLKLTTKPISADLSVITDNKGEARFDLPKPAPAYFYVRAALSGPHWDCFCLVRVSTEEVVQNGFMVRSAYAERTPKPSIHSKPGEVLFGLRPTPWWVRVLYPLLKV
jgi:hypothetical protein